MECLDGIRVFSALWVIYAHVHALMLMGPTTNLAYLPEVRKTSNFIIINSFESAFFFFQWASQYTSTVLLLAPLVISCSFIYIFIIRLIKFKLQTFGGHISFYEWFISNVIGSKTFG